MHKIGPHIPVGSITAVHILKILILITLSKLLAMVKAMDRNIGLLETVGDLIGVKKVTLD